MKAFALAVTTLALAGCASVYDPYPYYSGYGGYSSYGYPYSYDPYPYGYYHSPPAVIGGSIYYRNDDRRDHRDRRERDGSRDRGGWRPDDSRRPDHGRRADGRRDDARPGPGWSNERGNWQNRTEVPAGAGMPMPPDGP